MYTSVNVTSFFFMFCTSNVSFFVIFAQRTHGLFAFLFDLPLVYNNIFLFPVHTFRAPSGNVFSKKSSRSYFFYVFLSNFAKNGL